jgi:PIN domain nuclease of toxin-antitoxin system
VRLLLDTQTWLWMQVAPERLSDRVLELVQDPGADLVFSAASSWEIAIKYALGRLPLPTPPAEYVPDRIESSGVIPLPVEHAHALLVAELPQHHHDPFDRLLVAQAQLEDLAVLTADRQFEPYDVELVWADG